MRFRVGLVVAMVLAQAASGDAVAGEAFERAVRIDEVRRAELAFAATVAEDRPRVFAAMLDDGAVFVSGDEVARGKAAIVEAWKGFFGPERPRMVWRPEVVELSADGELGFTRGPWTLSGVDSAGAHYERSGIFNSVWRRQEDGGWKIVFDAGCSPCPRCE